MNLEELKSLNPVAITERIISGEFSIAAPKTTARSRIWQVFARIINRNGIEIPDYVYCKLCGKVFVRKQTTSNLITHKCYAQHLNDEVLDAVQITRKINSGEFIICEKPGRRKVWIVYAGIANRDGEEIKDYVYCKNCAKVFKFYTLSKSNLVKHKCYVQCFNQKNEISAIENEQPEMENEIEMEKPTIQPANQFEGDTADSVQNLITKWIIEDCRPYNLVQNAGLLTILQEVARLGSKFGGDLDIRKLLPTEPVIGQNVSTIYERCFEKVKSEINTIKENGFGLTSDIWSDNLSKQTYIALTIHYLKNGQLKYHLLGLKTFEGLKSSSQNVAEKVKQILKDFDCELSSKSIIVTDEDIFKTVPDIKHLPCISQLLDSALLKSLGEINEAAEIISSSLKLVSYLKKTGLTGFLDDDSLCNLYPTRWILIHKMLNSIESNWNEIAETLQSRNESDLVLKINIHHLRAMLKTFRPFKEAIATLEDDSCATLHLVLVYLHELKKSCDTDDIEFKDFDFIENLKKNLCFQIDQIVTKNITIIHKLALFLFPPTNKLTQFSNKEKRIIDEECIRLMKCFKTESETNTPVCKRQKLFSNFEETEAKHDVNELIIQEIQYYKNTRVVNSANFDIFGWWELQKDNFPLLYKLSCAVLVTPATSAASKRIFPAASKLLCESSYQSTQEAEAEKIMFIKSNSRHDEFESYFSVRNKI